MTERFAISSVASERTENEFIIYSQGSRATVHSHTICSDTCVCIWVLTKKGRGLLPPVRVNACVVLSSFKPNQIKGGRIYEKVRVNIEVQGCKEMFDE